jgi:phytoene desaturase
MSKEPRAAVIGAGFGGIAAAIRLQAAGIPTTLYEALDKPGGRAYVFQDQGYTFDAGPTVITAPHILEELYEVGREKLSDHVDLLPVKPFYRLLWQDGDRIDYAGSDSLYQQIKARSPEDGAGYLRFLDYSERVFSKGYEELVDASFLKLKDMFRVTPDLVRLRADRSVYATVAQYVKDEHVRQALSFNSLLIGGNPLETSSIYTLIHYLETKWGVFFARGGTHALVRALVELFQRLGGVVHLSSPVASIDLEDRSGKTVHVVKARGHAPEAFDLVVSNADLHHTYARLYSSTTKALPMRLFLDRAEWSMSLFVLYFGTNRSWDDLAHHTVIFGPRYEGLLNEIFHGKAIPEDFSLYLHAPTVTDPSLAPPGCGSYYVLSPVPHLGKARVDWNEEGPRYAERIIRALERHMPGLSSSIVTQRTLTPADFRDRLGAHLGNAFSIAPTLTQSAWFRAHNRDPRIPGLYIVGAGTHPGAGLPGVINSAKATVQIILRDLGRKIAA